MALDSDIYNADSHLHVEFYLNEDGEFKANPKEFVRIIVPGDKTNVVDNNGGHVTSQYMAIDAASIAAGMYAMVLELYKDYETRCQRRCVDDS